MAHYHPNQTMLMDYAAGSLPEALLLMVESHLYYCDICREEVQDYSALGGVFLEEEALEPLSPGLKDSVLALLDDPKRRASKNRHSDPDIQTGTASKAVVDKIKEDLSAYWGMKPQKRPPSLQAIFESLAGEESENWESLPWKKLPKGIQRLDLNKVTENRPTFLQALHKERADDQNTMLEKWDQSLQIQLIKVPPGGSVPPHTHKGKEMMLVLEGGFDDGVGRYDAGDFIVSDKTIHHHPKADPKEGCVCLIVLQGYLDFSGPMGRLLTYFSPRL